MPKGIFKHPTQCGFQKGHSSFLTKEAIKRRSETRKKNNKKRGQCKKCEICEKIFFRTLNDRDRLWNPRRFCSLKCKGLASRGTLSGENHWNWIKDRTDLMEKHRLRNSNEYLLWRDSVLVRDNYTCQKYGTKKGKMIPHHIQNFADYPELRFDVNNGITLSYNAHREFHKKYGVKNNTRGQLDEFLKN